MQDKKAINPEIAMNQRIKNARNSVGLSQEEFASKLEISRSNLSQIEIGKHSPTLSLVKRIARTFNIPIQELIEGAELVGRTYNTVQKPEVSYGKRRSIPLIPISAIAGNGDGEFQILESDIESRYVVPEFEKADFLIRVKGSSMYPKYTSGDILACVKLLKSAFIQWNKVYVLDTSQGPMVKRIIKAEKEKYWVLRSDNSEYPDFEVNIERDVYHINLVIGLIRQI